MQYQYGRPDFADAARAQQNCFLLTNGLGGYCSLSAAFSATRGDHALLMACTHAPTERVDLIHRLSETVTVGGSPLRCPPRTWPTRPTRTAGGI